MKYSVVILLLFLTALPSLAGKVVVINVDAGIGPGTASYIENSIEYAEEVNAEALIIKLDTPGGLLESTRDIVSDLLESPVPVVVYVSPGGARAGSAGVFITLAANIAAMTPGTNIGAAHPVGLGGESDSTAAMTDKVVNDASAMVRSIAQKRNKNQDWAEQAVRESVSATENEALELGVIDFVSPNLDSLLKQIHGMTVETSSGEKTLKTKNASLEIHEMNWKEALLMWLSDPNIAYIFILLAIYGVFFELYSPGAIFPGVIGGISALIAAYSLQMLPVNYAGLGLMLLAIVLFIIEIKVASYGMLTIGGVLSFLLGSIMLIDSPFEFMEISMTLIITASLLTAAFFAFVIWMGIKAQYRKKASGTDGFAYEHGTALSSFDPGEYGKVHVHGERWKAISEEQINEGDEIVVIESQGLLLKVKKTKN